MWGASSRTKKNHLLVWTKNEFRIRFAILAYWRMYELDVLDSLIGKPTNDFLNGKVIDLVRCEVYDCAFHLPTPELAGAWRILWPCKSDVTLIWEAYCICRYKMISKFTWPNFVAGTPKDGTRVLIEECGFENDVKYGRTKIFIRTPHTLFALEKVSAIFFFQLGHFLRTICFLWKCFLKQLEIWRGRKMRWKMWISWRCALGILRKE